MKLTIASRSEKGLVRKNNEDYVGFWQPASIREMRDRGALAIIADGVGGHGFGEVASQMAVETGLEAFRTAKKSISLNSMLWQVMNQANLAVYNESQNRPSAEGRMQTTMTAVVFRNDQIGIGHVGDCRTFLVRSGIAKLLTTDHTYVAFHRRMGLFSAQDAENSPMRGGLTRSIGNDSIVSIDYSYLDVYPGDYIVQCTDGVHVYINEEELVEIVTTATPADACDTILRVCEARGTEDNTTVQICRIDRVQHVNYVRGQAIYREENMDQELKTGDILDGRFEIVDVISRSGMASIYKAMDGQLGGRVALKVPHMQFESDPAFFSRFQREEEIGLALAHPGILRLIPVDADKKSRPYIAMELLSGETLDRIMQHEKPMEISKAIRIVAKLCDALGYMHEKGIIHRDLKPANIMICDDGSLRIMDFGIAKAVAMRRITFTGFSPTMGTPDYMAPEQVKGRRGDQRTDIYSLGAIFYEMVTGHTPFEGDNPFVIMQARILGDPEPPSKFNPAISPELEEIILHALERDPEKRYASALDIKKDLEHPEQVELTHRAARLQKAVVNYTPHTKWKYLALFLLVVFVAIITIYLVTSHRH